MTYLALAVAVVAVGLVARYLRSAAPGFVTACLGDTLWAVMFFLLLGALLPRAATLTVAVLTLILTLAIEFSQLYHAPWLDRLRAVPGGGLLLGNTFLWSDVACLLVGAALAAAAEVALRRRA